MPVIRRTGAYKMQKSNEETLRQRDVELYEKEQELVRFNRYIKRSRSNYAPGNCLYVLQNSFFPENEYKIGFTENLKKRIGSYNTSSAIDYQVEYVRNIEEMINIEGLIKDILRPYRINRGKEWFEVQDISTLTQEIDALCDYIEDRKAYHIEVTGRSPTTEVSSVPSPVEPPCTGKKNLSLAPSKPCNKCSVTKPLDEFNYAREHRDDRENTCKDCKRIRQAEVIAEQRANTEFPVEKPCKLCDQILPLEQFYRDKNAPDGRMRRCMVCHNERQKKPSETVIVTEKTCTSCKIQKPVSEYHKHSRSKDGYGYYCKVCASAKAKAQACKKAAVKNTSAAT